MYYTVPMTSCQRPDRTFTVGSRTHGPDRAGVRRDRGPNMKIRISGEYRCGVKERRQREIDVEGDSNCECYCESQSVT